MKKLIGLNIVIASLLVPFSAWAGCTVFEVCQDVYDSIIVSRGSGVTVSFSSDSEAGNLDHYEVVRSPNPAAAGWSHVDNVTPDDACGASPAEYEVQDSGYNDWVYAVRVFSTGGLVCTVVEHEEE